MDTKSRIADLEREIELLKELEELRSRQADMVYRNPRASDCYCPDSLHPWDCTKSGWCSRRRATQ